MDQRISLVTLGVVDVQRAKQFYEGVGWTAHADDSDDSDEIVFFQAGGMVLALWDRAKLAEDTAVSDSGGWGGITLAHNVASPDEVDRVIAEVRAAGGTVGRDPGPTFWGGYSAVFLDPDGHAWEVAHNPGWQLREDGSVLLAP